MIETIAINDLHPHPDNPRKELGDIRELTQSICTFGVLQNLTVVPAEDGNGYTVICGHRRLAAAKKAELQKVPCVIAEGMDRRTQVSIMLLENMQRSDLNYQEEAKGFQLMLDLGDDIANIAKQTGFSETKVRHRVKLNELDQEVLGEKIKGDITINDLIKLEKIKDPQKRNECLECIGTNNFEWKVSAAIREEARDKFLAALNEYLPEYEMTTAYWRYRYEEAAEVKMDGSEDDIEAFCQVLAKRYVAGQDIYIYIDYNNVAKGLIARSEEQEKPEKDPENDRRKRERMDRLAGLKAMKARVTDAHREFVRNVSENAARMKRERIQKELTRQVLLGNTDGVADDEELIFSLMGKEYLEEYNRIDGTKEYDEAAEEMETLLEETVLEEPDKAQLVAAYLTMELGEWDNPWNYDLRYGPHYGERLRKTTMFLGALGYEVSDDEAGFVVGDSNLYEKETPDVD